MQIGQHGQTLIIGDIGGLGGEFGRLVAAEKGQLLLVDSQRNHLADCQNHLHDLGAKEVRLLVESLSGPDAAEQIYTGWLLQSLLHEPPLALDLLINVLAFRPWPGPNAWDVGGPEPDLHLSNVINISHLFTQEMHRQGGGHILNVLSRPDQPTASLQGMFAQTETLLLEMTHRLNQRWQATQVNISTLSVSDHSIVVQGAQLPPHIAPDLLPQGVSLRDIATFGYGMARRGSSGVVGSSS